LLNDPAADGKGQLGDKEAAASLPAMYQRLGAQSPKITLPLRVLKPVKAAE